MRFSLGVVCLFLLVLAGCVPQGGQPSVGRGVKVEIVEFPRGELVETSAGGAEFGLGLIVSNFANIPIIGQLCVHDTPFGVGGIPEGTCERVDLQPAFETSDAQRRESYQTFAFGPFSYVGIRAGPPEQTTEISATLHYEVEGKHFAKLCLVQDERRTGTPSECKGQASLSVVQDQLPLVVKNVKKDVNVLRSGSAGAEALLVKLTFEVAKVEADAEILSLGESSQRSAASLVKVRVHGFGSDFACAPLTREGYFDFRSGSKNELRCTANVRLDQARLDDLVEMGLGYGVRQTARIPPVKLIKHQDQGFVA